MTSRLICRRAGHLCWALDNNLTRRVSAADAVALASIKGLVAGAVNDTLVHSHPHYPDVHHRHAH